MESFKDKLKALLTENSVSQEELALAVNVSQASISKYLRGSIPKSNISQSIATFFKVDHKWLASDSIDKTHLDYLTRQQRHVNELSGKIMELGASKEIMQHVHELADAVIKCAEKNIECAEKNKFLRDQIVKENKFFL
mgnify:CR=1 FL=1